MPSVLSPPHRWRLVGAVSLLLVGGCGSERGLPPAADADKARSALLTGLDAWKNGEKPDALKRHDPPIYFTDLAWEAGQRLEEYEIGGEMERSGQSVVASAVLTLRNRDGGSLQKNARYLIDTNPAVVIVPGDPPAKSE
jgi:hypothetical protein